MTSHDDWGWLDDPTMTGLSAENLRWRQKSPYETDHNFFHSEVAVNWHDNRGNGYL